MGDVTRHTDKMATGVGLITLAAILFFGGIVDRHRFADRAHVRYVEEQQLEEARQEAERARDSAKEALRKDEALLEQLGAASPEGASVVGQARPSVMIEDGAS